MADSPEKAETLASSSVESALSDPFETWLTESVGISKEMLQTLLGNDDDDWTFVIKIHGILEAGLNHLILARLGGNEKLAEVVSRLETNNARSGKIAFIKAYGLLTRDACLFVQLLSEVRNKCVHDIKNFNFSLRKFLDGQDSKQLKNWKSALTSWYMSEQTEHSRELAIRDPRNSIFNSCMMIVVMSYFNQAEAAQEQQKVEQAKKFFEGRTMWQGFDSPGESNPKE